MIYVTGSNGFVGKNLIIFLKNKKKKFKRIKRNNLSKSINSNYLNLPKTKDRENKYLIHLSSPALVKLYRKKKYSSKEVLTCIKNEISNASSLIQYCKENKFSKIIYISSSSVYGPRKYNAPFSERTKPNPSDDYSMIKLKVENFIKKNFENTIILRPFQIYGKFDNRNRLIPTLLYAKKNKTISLQNCLQVTDLIHVNDLCEVIYKLLYSNINMGIYNVGSSIPIKLREIVELIYKFKKKSFSYAYKKSSSIKVTNYCYANIRSLRKVLMWKPKIIFNEKTIKLIKL